MSLTRLLFRAARASATGRSIRKGRAAQRVARRAVRRYVAGRTRGWL